MRTPRAKRLEVLTGTLADGTSLHLREAAELLNVSEMTVRRDIAASGDVFAFLGGHIVRNGTLAGDNRYFVENEQTAHVREKQLVGRTAASLVEDNDTIFIDCGTTTPHLARALPAMMSLVVVCYAINIADIVCRMPNMQVILLGGLYHPSSASFASREALTTLRSLNINKAFLSAGGVHLDKGLSCSNFHEVDIKQIAIERSATRVLIADASKFGRITPAPFGEVADMDRLVVDDTLDASARRAFDKAAPLMLATDRTNG